MQFLLGPSERQAEQAVRCRIDFTYAMAMELDDPGFHHSALADFRDRLAEGDRADRLLDLVPARLKEAGLVRERTTRRTDSTHVLAAAHRPVSRLRCSVLLNVDRLPLKSDRPERGGGGLLVESLGEASDRGLPRR